MTTDFELISPKEGTYHIIKNVGDIFGKDAYLGPHTKYKAWHLQIANASMGRRTLDYKIGFRYGKLTGFWVLIVNGELKAKSVDGNMKFTDFTVKFKLGEDILEIKSGQPKSILSYPFAMYSNGTKLRDLRSSLEEIEEEKIPANIEIVEVRKCIIDGNPVAVYKICCELKTGEKILLDRRYSDFDTLDNIIRGLTGIHLKQTIPHIPAKKINPFFDQFQEPFINYRKKKLENYLKALLQNYKVACYTEVLCFIGLDPVTGAALDHLPTLEDDDANTVTII